jgi:EAL domain-containing protein (putative c-di-GMP-specific phosphodiesterase class I)
MAVNVSVRQFVQLGFVDLVRRTLEETALDPDVLEIEITESTLMKDAEGAIDTLRGLKALGIHLAIDDFGTGYSSLSHLKQFPIDRLKIDGSFVCAVDSDPGDAAITLAVIAMGERMRLRVTAEGVETGSQLDFLKSNHCEEIQGYYFCRPLPALDIPGFLRKKG